jgi:hypothetical protein
VRPAEVLAYVAGLPGELIAYVLTVLGVLIAAAVVDENAQGQGFGAERAWLYVTLLTIAYLVSRGLARTGRRDER